MVLRYVAAGMTDWSQVDVSSPGLRFITSCCLRRLVLRTVRLRIVAQASLMTLAVLPVSLLLVAFATLAVRIVDIRAIPASFSRIRPSTARYVSRILRRFLFWRTSSFLSIILRAVTTPCGRY
jgi:hypothetical protein